MMMNRTDESGISFPKRKLSAFGREGVSRGALVQEIVTDLMGAADFGEQQGSTWINFCPERIYFFDLFHFY